MINTVTENCYGLGVKRSNILIIRLVSCADPESFVRGGPTLTMFFFVFLGDEGREDPSTTLSGQLSARQRNAIKWCFPGVPMIAQQ